MKLKFKHQSFQRDAARAVTDIFIGQRYSDGFAYRHDVGSTDSKQGVLNLDITAFRNEPIMLDRESLIQNIREIQMSQDLEPITNIVGEGLNFTIEMETGTGKTFTYIKTMYELNKHYGWTKFIIVVPSIAIREGVVKSLSIMQDHFSKEYNGKRIEPFVYNSDNLSKIDAFALSPSMQVMVINTQAFNARGENARRLTSRSDKDFGYRVPLQVLAATNPIIIIDEPQSVLGADRNNVTRQKLKDFNPLFSLLYSATHRKEDIYNQVYRLDAIDAFNKKLVKKIEVLGVKQQGSTATNGFIYLDKIIPGKDGANPQARISFDVKTSSGTKQTSKLVKEGFDLFENSDSLEEYRDKYIIDRIDGVNGFIHLLNDTTLYEGEMIGSVNEELIRRIQIRETIRTHIERERKLYFKGIKVLSLFFIDHVDNYRIYNSNGYELGKYAKIFEEEYERVKQEFQPTFYEEEYVKYLSSIQVGDTHQGYFSRDKKGNFINCNKLERGTSDSVDVDAYNLIMKDKEALLSLNPNTKGSQIRFIFSHSALKEGWDNPNVFQICTLKNSDNETKKRQEVGRGMRLCVNQQGERQDEDVLGAAVYDTNILTIIASESYENFSKGLQDELAQSISTRPITVTAKLFEGKTLVYSTGKEETLSITTAAYVQEELVSYGYVKKGKLTPKYFEDKKLGTLDFGDYNDAKESIVEILDKVFNPDLLMPTNARKYREAKFNKQKFYNEFQDLWKRINIRTFYTVNFDTSELVCKSIKAIDDFLNVTEIRIIVDSGKLDSIRDKESLESGTAMKKGKVRTIHVKEAVGDNVKYDLVGRLVDITGLTRKAIVEILTGIQPSTFMQFKLNPEEFIIKVGKLINEIKAFAIIQHIEYHKLNDTFDESIFTENTIRGKIGENAIESIKSLYDMVVVDSLGTEKPFAEQLEKQEDVVVYTKLPKGFYINTPMGHYNPDWAIAFREGEIKHVYFVAETKGATKYALKTADIRDVEASKIECAKRHFAEISGDSLKFDIVSSYDELSSILTK